MDDKKKALLAASLGVAVGAGTSVVFGEMGLAVAGTAIGIGAIPVAAAGAVVGLAGYGIYKAVSRNCSSKN